MWLYATCLSLQKKTTQHSSKPLLLLGYIFWMQRQGHNLLEQHYNRSGFSLHCHRDNLSWSCSTWPWRASLTFPSLPALQSAQPALPSCSSHSLRSKQGAWATWQKPLELVSIRAMYSAPFFLLPSRAANFLLLGYTNCGISILYWVAAGSWGSTRHWWPEQAIVIPLCILCLSFSSPCNFRFDHMSFAFLISYPNLSVKGVHGSYFFL